MKTKLFFILLLIISVSEHSFSAVNLIISSGTVPNTMYRGSTYPITISVQNIGSTSTFTSFYINVSINTANSYNGNQTWLTDIFVSGGLNAGQTKTYNTNITIPCSYSTGTRYILAGADGTGIITESNDNDNTLPFGILLQSAVDLEPLAYSLSTSTINAGSSLNASFAINNNGGSSTGGAYTTGFYLSSNTLLNVTQAAYLGVYSNSTLSGCSQTILLNKSLTIPNSTCTGIYYLFLWTDNGEIISESLNNNNFQYISLSVNGINPPNAPNPNSASGITTTSFTANWNSSIGATSYYVDVSTNSGFSNIIFNNQNAGNITSYTFTGLNCNTTYYYRVRAANSCGTSNSSSTISLLTLNCPCSYSINPTNIIIPFYGTSGTIQVLTQPGCNWSASSNDNWLTITSGNSGNGNGTCNYSVSDNTLPVARTGSITINGNIFTLNQGANPVPAIINSPLPSVISYPGLFQSNLPLTLQTAPIPMPSCIPPFSCQDVFNQTPQYLNNTTTGELIPRANDCFSSLNNKWEFRQRGYITGNQGNPCNTLTCSPSSSIISHSQNACSNKDDRFAWDVNLSNINESGICVYAIESGVISSTGNQHICIEHTNISGDLWYSWYDNIIPNSSLPVGSVVMLNHHIGHIKQISAPHLHFGVYYKKTGAKLYSVNRVVVPDYINNFTGLQYTISTLQGTCTGSIVSGANIHFKKENIWFYGGKTDKNGKFSITVIPGLNSGDSVKIIANGYQQLNIRLDSTNNFGQNIKIPLIKLSSINGVVNPKISITNNLPYFSNPNIQLNISGENFNTYDILQIYYSEDSMISLPISINNPFTNITANIALADTGLNSIGVLFKGSDSILVVENLLFLPLTNNYDIQIISDSSAINSHLYLNGQYLKDILNSTEILTLKERTHSLTFSKLGYFDSTFNVNSLTTINLSLSEIPANAYSSNDSSIINFPLEGNIQYRSKVTLLDSAIQSVISIKQYEDNFADMGLIPKSRKFEITHLNSNWSNIRFTAVLDQVERLYPDSIYLLRVFDDSIFTKIHFDSLNIAIYDSSVQKLDFNYINFNNGTSTKESIIVMHKQAPIINNITLPNITQNDTLLILLPSIFSDPDSILNDLDYSIGNISGQIFYQIHGDSLWIFSGNCWSGNGNIGLIAEHDGLFSEISLNINIIGLQSPVITPNGTTTFCQGDSVTLSSSIGNSYLWSNGSINQNIIVSDSGDYSVTIFDSNGCSSTSSMIHITVHDNPNPFILGSTTFCFGDSTLLEVGFGYIDYLWSTGDTSQTTSIFTGGNYVVTVTDSNNCQGSSGITVIINSLPTPSILGDDSLCVGDSTTLIANNGFSDYLWSTGDTSQIITISTAGSYTITVTDGNGCQGTTSFAVIVDSLPTPTIAGNTSFCFGDSTTLDAGSGYTNYLWSTTAISQIITTATAGTFSVTVTDVNSCSNTTSLNVTVNSADTSVTANGFTLTANAPSATYQWIYCDSVAIIGDTNQVFVATQNGSYSVIVSQNGCTDTSSCYLIVGVGISQINSASNISIYPNPTNGLLNIKVNGISNEKCKIILTNTLGQILNEIEFKAINNSIETQIDMSGLSSGIYFLAVTSNKIKQTFKVQKL